MSHKSNVCLLLYDVLFTLCLCVNSAATFHSVSCRWSLFATLPPLPFYFPTPSSLLSPCAAEWCHHVPCGSYCPRRSPRREGNDTSPCSRGLGQRWSHHRARSPRFCHFCQKSKAPLNEDAFRLVIIDSLHASGWIDENVGVARSWWWLGRPVYSCVLWKI